MNKKRAINPVNHVEKQSNQEITDIDNDLLG